MDEVEDHGQLDVSYDQVCQHKGSADLQKFYFVFFLPFQRFYDILKLFHLL